MFVSAPPGVCIPEIVRVLKCVSAQLLFREFPRIKLRLWGGHLWSEKYVVRTSGAVPSWKIEEYINRAKKWMLAPERRVVHLKANVKSSYSASDQVFYMISL